MMVHSGSGKLQPLRLYGSGVAAAPGPLVVHECVEFTGVGERLGGS